MVHALPYRHATIHCPRCRTSELTDGVLRHCANCRGAWIPHEALIEHVGAMQADIKPQLEWSVSNARLGLPCASCKHTMEALLLFDVPVDRCHSHGVWFDRDELAETLRRSAGHVRRDDGKTADTAFMAAELGDASTVVATEVAAEVTSGILEGVLDVIGGIFSAIDP